MYIFQEVISGHFSFAKRGAITLSS